MGHFAAECYAKINSSYNRGRKSQNKPRDKERSRRKNAAVNNLDEMSLDFDQLELNSIHGINYTTGDQSHKNKSASVQLLVNEVVLDMEVDTGASVSVISEDMYHKFFSQIKLVQINCELQVITGQNVMVVGVIPVQVSKIEEDKIFHLEVVVISSEKAFVPLVGRKWLDTLWPEWRNCFKVNSLELFNWQNTIKVRYPNTIVENTNNPICNFQAELILAKECTPIFAKPYSVPLGIKQPVEKELDSMCRSGILTPIRHSQWASPIVVAQKKDGSVRICMDCKRTINKYLETEHYPLPRVDEILANLSNCAYFSVIDLKGAYLQVELSENSKKLMVINTHKGLYQFNRLPFGVKSAPSIFQELMDKILSKHENVQAYIDDILIGDATKDGCMRKVEEVLKTLNDFNIKVNYGKSKFLQESVEYLGHTICRKGISPSHSKVRSIVEAPSPSNLKEVQAYLGLLNFYGKFLPKLSTVMRPLYDLLKKDTPFKWGVEQKNAFVESKRLILSSKILVHFDSKKPLILSCDASPYGVGAVLSHLIEGVEKPIAFASCSLTGAQKNYSQIQKEAFAIIFGVRKFNKYLFGVEFTIHTDHRPLEAIFGHKNCTPVAAARLQRWAIELSQYRYSIIYKKGKLLNHADALSRLPLPTTMSEEDKCINLLSSGETPVDFKSIQLHSQKDKFIQKIIGYLKNGWPKIIGKEEKYFKNNEEKYSCDGDCLFYLNRVVIPEPCKNQMLGTLHEGHTGIVRMKQLARQFIWWYGIDKDIEDFVKNCSCCQRTQNKKPILKDTSWPKTRKFFERVHLDFFYFKGNEFLILVDDWSKWIEVFILKRSRASDVIAKLRQCFSTFGIPQQIVSDNGPPFGSSEFLDFCMANNIYVFKSPPYHPRSNGLAERGVQTVKCYLNKFDNDSKYRNLPIDHKISILLFVYRNTPTTSTMKSPAQMIFSFNVTTKLSLLKKDELFKEKQTNFKNNCSKVVTKDSNLSHKNPIAVEVVTFKKNDYCLYLNEFKNTTKWIKAIIIEKISKLLYKISINGVTKLAHVDQLKKYYENHRYVRFNLPITNEKEVDKSYELRRTKRIPKPVNRYKP